MSVDYDKTIFVRFTDQQRDALDALAEDAGVPRATYVRACLFGERPAFKSPKLRERFKHVEWNDEDLKMGVCGVKVTSEQYDILHEMVKDSHEDSIGSYVRACVFGDRPPVRNTELDIRRIRAGRYEKRPMSITELRRLGRVIQGATRIRADKRKHSITLTLLEEDWDYLSDFFNWKENDA